MCIDKIGSWGDITCIYTTYYWHYDVMVGNHALSEKEKGKLNK